MTDEAAAEKPAPNHSTRFGAGNNANPQGKTSAQKKMEMANAERATRLRGRFLESLELIIEQADRKHAHAIADGEEMEDHHTATPMMMITNEVLKLLKDTEDRGLGTAMQSINLNADVSLAGKSDAEIANRLAELSAMMPEGMGGAK
jgi:hypothetical protein